MGIKLLAFDLDGTTIVEHWRLPEENRRALLAAAEQGVLLVPATGRMRSFLPKEILALPVRYAITSNGGAVYDLSTGQVLFEELIPNALARQVHRVLSDYDIYMEYYTRGRAVTQKPLRDRALSGMLPESKHWLVEQKDYIYTEDIGELLAASGLCPEKINLPCLDAEQQREIRLRLEALGGLGLTSSIPDNMEINARKAHKGGALLALADRLGLEREELFSVGDNGNDVTMLEAAGGSAAVANGTAEARAAARYQTGAHNEGGLAQAVERYVLR